MNLLEFLHDQIYWSEKTFGPGPRSEGICNHISKELKEIAEATDKHDELMEFVDVVILALDGAWRLGFTPHQIALAMQHKLSLNKTRTWPDWRQFKNGEAIEHVRDLSHKCCICHTNPVTPELGEDTCESCLNHV